MSSEGSVTSSASRIRQFGLYRTIDARTEEFLRSSRKRQIRQGCACAAISTAITVTVVVTVILVYEYSINSQANANKKTASKPNWIGLINDSDITSISSKFNKKINFDKTTIKFLPILLKALNKNRYIEKILEDYSSSSPPFTGKDSTETFTRNFFADSKNWIKLPTTRHYTLDYKTSPFTFWKTPTQRQDYLTKIRKIRDYQRMLNYFDKMINDKNGSNQRKEYEYTETPFVAQTVPMKKSKPRKIPQYPHSLSQLNPKEYKSEEKGAHTSCKCPKSLGSLLSKLIAGIQDILPHIMDTKVIAHAPCGNNTKSVTVPPQNKTYRQNEKKRKPKTKTSPFKSQLYTAHPVRTYFDTERKSKRKFKVITSKNIASTFTTSGTIPIETTTSSTTSTTTTAAPRTTTTPRTTSSTTAATTTLTTPIMFTSTADFSTATILDDQSISVEIKDSKKTVGHSTIRMPTKINITQPTLLPSEIINYDYNFIFKPEIRKKSTKMTNIRNPTTEIFIPMKFVDSSHESSTTKKLTETYTVSSHRPRVNVPLFKEEEYDDYFITTPSKSASELENLDVPNLKLIKNKMTTSHISPQPTTNINKMFVKLKSSSFRPVTKQPDLDFVSMRKMADLIYSPQEKTTKETKYTTETKVSVPFHRKYTEPSLLTDSISTYSIDNHQNNGISPSTSSKDTKRMTNPVSDIKTYNNEDTKFNDDLHISEILLDDEFQEEYSFRQMDITTKDPNKYVNSPKGFNKTEDMNLEEMKTPNKWEVNKNEQTEKVINRPSKSMLPSMRPSYLQIQRNNEWRQDDHADYDINFNNNIFDLPNII